MSSAIPPFSPPASPGPVAPSSEREHELMRAARGLEATFLAEMLKAAGVGKPPESFGGGVGEEQFSSFLVQEQAKGMVEAGGIGLAQVIFEAMKERAHD